jgi:hypothetical protein
MKIVSALSKTGDPRVIAVLVLVRQEGHGQILDFPDALRAQTQLTAKPL